MLEPLLGYWGYSIAFFALPMRNTVQKKTPAIRGRFFVLDGRFWPITEYQKTLGRRSFLIPEIVKRAQRTSIIRK